MLLEDPEVIEQTKQLIAEQNLSAEYAYQVTIDQFISLFENMDDDYLRGRALDIRDISQRVLKNLAGVPIHDLSGLCHIKLGIPLLLLLRHLGMAA